ncbi:MAG TPA: hypothetical protein VFZ91_05600 [Allosphingosinicella sp.]
MSILVNSGRIFLAFAASGSASAAPADPSARFAAEALRICIDTRAAAASVRQLAAAERWTPIDSKSLPGESSITMGDQKLRRNVTYYPSDVWTFDRDGLALTVLVYDIPDRPKVKHCEVMAWDLDSAAVDRALKSDPRVKGGFFERPGLPFRRYDVKKPRTIFRYGSGAKDSRTLHVLSAG